MSDREKIEEMKKALGLRENHLRGNGSRGGDAAWAWMQKLPRAEVRVVFPRR